MRCRPIGIIIAVAGALALLIGGMPDQSTQEKPWEQWEPPAVKMPDPNAWEIYEQAFALEDQIEARLAQELPAGASTVIDMSEQSLEPETLAMLVQAYRPVFSALDSAIAGEAQAPPIRGQDGVEAAFPQFAMFRQAARMFVGRSVYHLRQDDAISAALDAIAAMHIGADVGTNRTLIAGLVQNACTAIGEARLREAIPHLNAQEARIAANALRRAMAEQASYAEMVEGEAIFGRTYFIETTVKLLDVDPEKLQAIAEQTNQPELAAQGMTAEGTWQALEQFYARAIEEAGKPLWARREIPVPDNPLVANMVEPLTRTGSKVALLEAQLRVDLTALAAQAYWAEHGAYPTDLSALVPQYLAEIPRDPFADSPLLGAWSQPVTRAHPAAEAKPAQAAELMIYSVGPDGDDDGGVDIGPGAGEQPDGDVAVTLGGR